MFEIKFDTMKLILEEHIKTETAKLALEMDYLMTGDIQTFKEAKEQHQILKGIERFYDKTFTEMDKHHLESLVLDHPDYKPLAKKYREIWNQHFEMSDDYFNEWNELQYRYNYNEKAECFS